MNKQNGAIVLFCYTLVQLNGPLDANTAYNGYSMSHIHSLYLHFLPDIDYI